MGRLVNEAPNFNWRNYGVLRHDAVVDRSTDAGFQKLKSKLRGQIPPVNCVLVLPVCTLPTVGG